MSFRLDAAVITTCNVADLNNDYSLSVMIVFGVRLP
jgi:hypothetical protein